MALMLAMALLPGLSRAWAMGQGGDWVEICSVQGSRWVQLELGDKIKPMADPCAACLQAVQPLAPPLQLPSWQLPQAFDEVPPAFLQAPRLLAVWRHALSRGPPLSLS